MSTRKTRNLGINQPSRFPCLHYFSLSNRLYAFWINDPFNHGPQHGRGSEKVRTTPGNVLPWKHCAYNDHDSNKKDQGQNNYDRNLHIWSLPSFCRLCLAINSSAALASSSSPCNACLRSSGESCFSTSATRSLSRTVCFALILEPAAVSVKFTRRLSAVPRAFDR